MDLGTLRGLATLLALLAFVGVVVGLERATEEQFDQAAHMPLEEDLHKNEDK